MHALCSWNATSVTRLSDQLRTNASVAARLAAQQLPEFGVKASSIRSVTVKNTAIIPITTRNGTAYRISIKLTAVLVSRGEAKGGVGRGAWSLSVGK